jgi:serine/threonine protein kinase
VTTPAYAAPRRQTAHKARGCPTRAGEPFAAGARRLGQALTGIIHTQTMPLSSASWDRVRALFEAASDLDGPGREALIQAAKLPAEALAELRSLLRHHDQATGSGSFLHGPAEPPPPPGAARAGQRLGAWQIVRPLGSGGMGEVFEARRADGSFEGRAAVKLLKRGMDSAAVLARFAQERQALARLNHPHIARLLDAGASEEGLPYFVMEYVEGRPIDEAARALPLEARLALFLQLADAVAHAHRSLLVHRDLKPGNVLVDGEGRVKLLDFGIAKALDPLEATDAALTQAGERPFTPHYASPEQVRGEPVSTATDVYSLGVLLYVMLTEQRPYGRTAATPAEAARSVLEEEPARPSSLQLAEAGWERTRRRLQGDLDNILLKALAKPTAERYASVDALAADVRAFVEGRPVSARPASPGYVLAKLLRRHRWAALAALLGALGLATGLVAALVQARAALALGAVGLGAGLVMALVQARRAGLARDDAARSRDEARHHLVEVRRLANTLVFEVNDALERGATEGRRQLVHAAAQSLERQAAYGPLADTERIELGQALARLARIEGHEHTANLGDVPAAIERYRQALALLSPLAPRQDGNVQWHAAMVGALEGHASVLRSLKRLPEARVSMEHVARHAERAAALEPGELRWRIFRCAATLELTEYDYPPVRWAGLGRLASMREGVAQALLLTEALVAGAQEQPRAWRLRASALLQRSGLQAIDGELGPAIDGAREALAVLDRLAAWPGGQAVREGMFVALSMRLAVTLRAAGREAEALQVTLAALDEGERALRADPNSEYAQSCFVAPVQTAMDLHLQLDEPERALGFHHLAAQRLGAEPTAAARPKVLWQQAWLHSLAVPAALACGRRAEAVGLAARLQRWLREDAILLRAGAGPLDCELEAQMHGAAAVLAAAEGRAEAAAAATAAANERLDAMRALRDPGDAIELIRAFQQRARLALALRRQGGAPLAGAVAALFEAARADEAALLARGLIKPGTRRESGWLAEAGG